MTQCLRCGRRTHCARAQAQAQALALALLLGSSMGALPRGRAARTAGAAAHEGQRPPASATECGPPGPGGGVDAMLDVRHGGMQRQVLLHVPRALCLARSAALGPAGEVCAG